MKCPHCGQEHIEGAQFCTLTGKKILPAGVCSQCGQPVEPEWQHCGFCGQLLAPASPPAAPARPPEPLPVRAASRATGQKSPEKQLRWGSSTLILGAIGIILCVAVIGFINFGKKPAAATPTSSALLTGQADYTHFSRWGLSFDYLKEWKEESADQVAAMKAYVVQQLAPYGRTLQEITLFTPADNATALFISVYTTSRPMTRVAFIAERKQVYLDAQRAGDVTRVNDVSATVVAGLPAVLEDVERSNGGRGWTCKIIKGTMVYEISFIVNTASQFPQYTAFLEQLVAGLQVTAK